MCSIAVIGMWCAKSVWQLPGAATELKSLNYLHWPVLIQQLSEFGKCCRSWRLSLISVPYLLNHEPTEFVLQQFSMWLWFSPKNNLSKLDSCVLKKRNCLHWRCMRLAAHDVGVLTVSNQPMLPAPHTTAVCRLPSCCRSIFWRAANF